MMKCSFVLVSCFSAMLGLGLSYADGLLDLNRGWMGFLAVVLLSSFWETYFRGILPGRVSPGSQATAGKGSPLKTTILSFALLLTGMAVSFILVVETQWQLAIVLVGVLLAAVVTVMDRACHGASWRQSLFSVLLAGPVCLGGSYFVGSLEINNAVLVAGFVPGLFAFNFCVLSARDLVPSPVVFCFRLFPALAGLMLLPVIIHLVTEDHLRILYASFIPVLFLPIAFRAVSFPQPRILIQTRWLWLACQLAYSGVFLLGWIL